MEGKLPFDLARRARAGTLSHAYILTGPDRDAAEALAASLAAAMVCEGEGEKPCGLCRHCRKALKGVHPDVIRREAEEGKDFTVAQARALRADAYIRPNEARRKVYLIADAHRMNQSAQNALLKVLEEGPPYAAFLLLTTQPEALLATIRSRCETVRAAGEAREDAELQKQGEALARRLLAGDGWALAEWCVPLERGKRDETAALWDAAREALLPRARGKDKERCVALMEELGELSRLARRNVNLGALWGRLYALAG